MGSCCDMWNAKPFYCNSFKLWELAAPHYDYSELFVGGRQRSGCLCQCDCKSRLSRQSECIFIQKSVWVRLRLRGNQKKRMMRISTYLDQCQVFQIEPEEMISRKEWNRWVNGAIIIFFILYVHSSSLSGSYNAHNATQPPTVRLCCAIVVLSF